MKLTIELELPDDMTPDEVKEYKKRLAGMAGYFVADVKKERLEQEKKSTTSSVVYT